jgi:hypothetical protein
MARLRFVVLQALGAAALGFGGVMVLTSPQVAVSTVQEVAAPIAGPAVGCNIKGNISIDTGERIYHMPGQRYYAQTKISPQYGERWFCSEADARAAGWRKSKS